MPSASPAMRLQPSSGCGARPVEAQIRGEPDAGPSTTAGPPPCSTVRGARSSSIGKNEIELFWASLPDGGCEDSREGRQPWKPAPRAEPPARRRRNPPLAAFYPSRRATGLSARFRRRPEPAFIRRSPDAKMFGICLVVHQRSSEIVRVRHNEQAGCQLPAKLLKASGISP